MKPNRNNFLLATLALSGLLGALPVEAKESHTENQPGDLEHFHHEAYSHSEVDPNYHEDQGTAAVSKAPHHKNHRRYGQPDSGVSFAFGGHRRDRH